MAMAMAPLKVKALTVLLLLAAPTLVVSEEEAPPSSSAVYHFKVIHADANGHLSRPAEAPGGGDTDTTTHSDRAIYGGEYLMVVDMGAPKTTFTAVVDTGSDVTWTRKKEQRDHARRRECRPSDLPQDCVFHKQYGRSKLGVTGFMADETLFFPSSSSKGGEAAETPVAVGSVPLGCAQKCHDDKGDMDCNRLIPEAADGVIGLNMGPESLLNKLGFTRLSYCLGSRLQRNPTSPLWLGGAKLSLAADVQRTPLVQRAGTDSGSVWANKYYVELEGISVTPAAASASASAGKVLSIPKEAFNHTSSRDAGGVMIVDSGCTYSKLETAAYNVVKNLLAEQLNAEPFRSNNKLWTCFKVPHNGGAAANGILVNLHLAKDRGGATATMSLGWSNYMMPGDETGTTSCLAIKDSGQGISVLGNFQQHNIHMLYDLAQKELSFVPVEDCSASNIKLID